MNKKNLILNDENEGVYLHALSVENLPKPMSVGAGTSFGIDESCGLFAKNVEEIVGLRVVDGYESFYTITEEDNGKQVTYLPNARFIKSKINEALDTGCMDTIGHLVELAFDGTGAGNTLKKDMFNAFDALGEDLYLEKL